MTCKDCNYHRADGTCANKQADYFGLAIEDGCVWHEADWIRVEDELPEPEQLVLAFYRTMGGDNYRTAYYTAERYGWTDGEYVGISVTHWMPLPEPPRD